MGFLEIPSRFQCCRGLRSVTGFCLIFFFEPLTFNIWKPERLNSRFFSHHWPFPLQLLNPPKKSTHIHTRRHMILLNQGAFLLWTCMRLHSPSYFVQFVIHVWLFIFGKSKKMRSVLQFSLVWAPSNNRNPGSLISLRLSPFCSVQFWKLQWLDNIIFHCIHPGILETPRGLKPTLL